MATVTVPPEFFRAELRMYTDWREALARELVQNAVDAGATCIDVDYTVADGQVRLTFSDDGCGMDRAVLEEVFFALGRTTKRTADTIGGFGRARIITCFAQERYQIETGGLVVDGCGGDYTIAESGSDTPGAARGCRFIIDLADDDIERHRRSMRRLLGASALTLRTQLDGQPFTNWTSVGRARRVLRDEAGRPWGRVHVRERAVGQLIVRVNGLKMFTRYLPGTDDVIVELEPRRSREVLAAGRDQLAAGFAGQLDQFVDAIAQNRRQTLSAPERQRTVRLHGGGFMVASPPQNSNVDSEPANAAAGRAGGALAGGNGDTSAVAPRRTVEPCDLLEDDTGANLAGFGFDVFLLTDGTDNNQARRLRTWDPRRWDAQAVRRRRVVGAWVGAVEYGVELLMRRREFTSAVHWTVGVVISSEVAALCRSDEHGHVLAINPHPSDGPYVISNPAHRRRLLAMALHEVAHICTDGHDETFAALLTDLYAHVDPADSDRRIRAGAARAGRAQ
jgi:hypothetical protein